MIKGTKPVAITKYLPLSIGSEIYSFCIPGNDEKFVGYPYGYCSDNSEPFIEILQKSTGKLLTSINCRAIDTIVFEETI